MRIGVVEVFVEDQDKARAFYSEVLGLQLKGDAPYSAGPRWLTVVSPEDSDGTELLLTPASAALQAARREIGKPAITFRTADCRRTHRELANRGVVFLAEPKETPYGVHAVFENGCGNLINLHQETTPPSPNEGGASSSRRTDSAPQADAPTPGRPHNRGMTMTVATAHLDTDHELAFEDARRWVRRKRILFTIVGMYAVLSLMWFVIDLADDSEGFWFYWPMLGTGVAVAVAAVGLLGLGGIFGAGWEQREIERYLARRR